MNRFIGALIKNPHKEWMLILSKYMLKTLESHSGSKPMVKVEFLEETLQ